MTGIFMLFVHASSDDIAEAERLAAEIPDSASAHITVRALMPLPGIPGVIPSATHKQVPGD